MHNDELPYKLQFKFDNKQNIIVQPYLLRDFAYPICVGFLKCFTPRGTTIVQQNQFDSKQRAGRAMIKNAFGILIIKWLIPKRLNCNLKYAPTLIITCYILHNFCIGTGDVEKDDEIDDKPNSEHPKKIILTLFKIKNKNRVKIQKEALF